jgi:hypothetical protein
MYARNNIKKQFCKVCFDAGKPEQVYTSHYVKSAPGPNSKVVCPTLLSQDCGYCFKSGHTPKFCPVIAKNKAAEDKARKQAMYSQEAATTEQKKQVPKKHLNAFAALDSSDSETEAENITAINTKVEIKSIEEEFPALSSSNAKKPLSSKAPIISGYATAAAANVIECDINVAINKSTMRQMPPLNRTKTQQAVEEYKGDDDDSWTEAYVPPKPLSIPLASQINWSFRDDDSDDEDW